MLRKFILLLKSQHLQAIHEQRGQSIIIFVFATLGLVALMGLALDLGLVYIEKVKINRATDATALAAVVELPFEQDTWNRAIEYIRFNGYDVGVDTDILVRGCAVTNNTYLDSRDVTHVYNRPSGAAQNVGEAGFTNPMTRTEQVVGARYITATQQPPRATFVIDTGGYQGHNGDGDDAEECSSSILGTATKLRVSGVVTVPMSFMQFFGFARVPVQDAAVAENLSSLDVMVVFDVSGSMEDQTVCHDCWVRTSYGPAQYPDNGYFNPIPYNPAWAVSGTGNQSIPASALCTAPPSPFTVGTYKYLTLEAELYSHEEGNWSLDARTPGQGFWVIQRGSRLSGNNALGEDNMQTNSAGITTTQSSNVCGPNVSGNQIDCTVGNGQGDNVCDSADGGHAVDCSAYIQARPFLAYGQRPGDIPNINGAAYNADCFSGAGLSGNCWASSPFNPVLGAGPSQVPWVEYDFTPTWSQTTTSIWIRAIGGGDEAYTWAGSSPDQLQPDYNGGGATNNLADWRKVIFWQVNNSAIISRTDNINADYDSTVTDDNNGAYHMQSYTDWRDNRADNSQWRWIKLGSTTTVSGTQYTLKLYQGSAGYKVDKLVFTNDPTGDTPKAGAANPTIPAALRRTLNGGTATGSNNGTSVGPPASWGSATREACNVCNPIYGYTVNQADCSCRLTYTDTVASGGYGSGSGCTVVLTGTNQIQAEFQTGLYSGLQPIRSAQEAVKSFARKLNPKFDQLGIVAFTAGGDNTEVQASSSRRSKLMCQVWASKSGNVPLGRVGNAARCYDTSLGTPLTYTNVISAVEKHWAESGTNIAIGMREGLEELGVSTTGNTADSTCTDLVNDGHSCARPNARKIIILMTDGSPNDNPGNCAPGSGGRPDLWDGDLGPDDDDFECAMYLAYQAAEKEVTVYTIGIGAGANQDLLTAMATGVDPRGDAADVLMFTGATGQFFPAAKPSDLEIIFEAILSNIYVRIVS